MTMGEWKEYKLRDLTTKIGSGATPTGGDNAYKLEGISLIRSQNVLDFQFSYNGLAFIDDEQADALRNVTVQSGDVLLNITGDSVARVCKVPEKILSARVNQHVAIIRADKEKLDSDYLLYNLQAKKEYLLSISEIGATRRALTKGMLEDLDLQIPDLPEQKSIASILSSLDDKIDLLLRQNKTLEGMAEALWRKMFVEDADPGWGEKGLDEIATFLNGLPCQKYLPDTSTEPLPVIKIKELRTGITDDSDLATSKVPPEYIIDDGDVLFSWSGSLEVIIWSFGKGVLNQHLFKATSVDYPKWFYYYWIKQHLAEFRDIAQDKATTMGHIQRHHLSAAKVLIPDEKSFAYLNTQIGPGFEKLAHNLKAIRKLAHLRDTLLPKLMSGEVRVKL